MKNKEKVNVEIMMNFGKSESGGRMVSNNIISEDLTLDEIDQMKKAVTDAARLSRQLIFAKRSIREKESNQVSVKVILEPLEQHLLDNVEEAHMLVREQNGIMRIIWALPEGTTSERKAIRLTNTRELSLKAFDIVLDDDSLHLTFSAGLLTEESISGLEDLG